jgi:hypothetical protein
LFDTVNLLHFNVKYITKVSTDLLTQRPIDLAKCWVSWQSILSSLESTEKAVKAKPILLGAMKEPLKQLYDEPFTIKPTRPVNVVVLRSLSRLE